MKAVSVSIDADTYYQVLTFLEIAVRALEQQRQVYVYQPEEVLALHKSMINSAHFIFPESNNG